MDTDFLCFSISMRTVPLASMESWLFSGSIALAAVLIPLLLCAFFLGIRYIPHDSVGVVEKLWSSDGSLTEGRIIALRGEAGYQADLLRGGIHVGYWRWQYAIHRCRLVTVPQGKIGYVYARDGEPLPPSQTLARVVACGNYQDSRAFLEPFSTAEGEPMRGQRGRQRAILREGVYAINPALFVVMTENNVYSLRHLQTAQETSTIQAWYEDLRKVGGFNPVVIGQEMAALDPIHADQTIAVDSIGIVTVHDGPSLEPGEIIAPTVGSRLDEPHYHNNYQDAEAFLAAGGRRGRQHQPLTDGTYFINRWFASIELIPKTVVPIGYVGVVVSYYGRAGLDRSGEAFRHGERVIEGERGVWERPLGPGKYAFNTYAGNIVHVPTTNFVLHWITGRIESHRYDESLKSVELVTRDAYEPSLPLSVVVHIDYLRAPNVIQRFGDVKRLITQTLDPLLSAYFRDIAHRHTMLGLLHDRDAIQAEAREELRRRFHEFDIECVDVLIGKPTTGIEGGKIENLLEQLRLRQLSIEQLETFERQREAAEKQRLLNEAQAQSKMQTELTNTRVQAQIAESQGEAELQRARKQAEQAIVLADADLQRARRQAEQTIVLAEANSQQQILAGRGEAQRALEVGTAKAAVLLRKVSSFGDPRLYAMSQISRRLADSSQPLVPERVFITGGGGGNDGDGSSAHGLIGMLLSLLVAEKTGMPVNDNADLADWQQQVSRMTTDAAQHQQKADTLSAPADSKVT